MRCGLRVDAIMNTPRPSAKRRLVYTTPRPFKRLRQVVKGYRANYRHYVPGPRTTGTLVQQVKSLQRVVKALSPEKKFFDVSLNQTNVSNTGAVTHVTGIAEGDSLNTRTGRLINVLSVSVKGSWTRGSTTSTASPCYRVLLVCDKQQVADTLPSCSDVISDAGFSAHPIMVLPNTANLERFRLLYVSPLMESARGMMLGNNGISGMTQSNCVDHTWIGSIKVEYNGSNAGDIQKNGLYVLFLTDDITSTPDFTGICRVAFTDV